MLNTFLRSVSVGLIYGALAGTAATSALQVWSGLPDKSHWLAPIAFAVTGLALRSLAASERTE